MGSIVVDCLTLPVPGRIVQSPSEIPLPSSMVLQISAVQAIRNRDTALPPPAADGQPQSGGERPSVSFALSAEMVAKIRAGKDLMWTSDLNVELPIRISDSGPGALPAVTVVEFFADCVRRFGSEPALLFEPHFPQGGSSPLSEEPRPVTSGVSTEPRKKPEKLVISRGEAERPAALAVAGAGRAAEKGKGVAAAASRSGSKSFNNNSNDDGGTQRVFFAKGSPPNTTCPPPPSYLAELQPGWSGYTWQGYWTDVCFFAKSLLFLELPLLARVAIMGCNAPAWAISFFGTIFAGCISVGVYTTNSADACRHIIEHSQCHVAIVDSMENAHKLLGIRQAQLQQQLQQRERAARQPGAAQAFRRHAGGSQVLQLVVVYRDLVPVGMDSGGVVVGFDEFLLWGRGVVDALLTARMELQRPGNCCTVVYTSGTTGFPKGVMLSHDNLTWTATCMAQIVTLSCRDRIVSLLPLSHVAAQIVDLVGPLIMGTAVYFARPDALTGTLLQTLLKARPTWFLAVPRIWEKIEQRLKEVGSKAQGLRLRAATAAKDLGYRGSTALLEGRKPPFGFGAVNNYLLHQIRKALGLDKCHAFGSCAAPIDAATQKYFLSLGMPINSIYGLSESAGPQTFVAPAPGWFKTGSIGHSMPGTDTVIYSPDSNGEGEICFRGRNVFMGYLLDDKSTMEAIDTDGFLHTGDLGNFDKQGFLFITGRAKELLITAGGENVAPVLIESVIRQEVPFVSNCMVIGDKRRFLAVLICLFTTRDDRDNPTQHLGPEVCRVIGPRGSGCVTTAEAAEDPILNKLILEGLDRANQRAVSRAQRVLAWRVLPIDFSVSGGELTATLKLRRKIVLQRYSSLVEKMYAEPHPPCLRKGQSRL